MKKVLVTGMMIGVLLSSVQAKAQGNGIDGLILGAGSGALIGQAIGRNTEATLIGSAVGTMLGYIVGNEMEKGGAQVVSSRPPVSYRAPVRTGRYYRQSTAPPQTEQPLCRETELLATIDGYPEKVFATVCWQDGKWVVADDAPTQTVIFEKNQPMHPRYSSWRGRPYASGNQNLRWSRW